MKLSIIVPCFNAADKIGRCITSLKKTIAITCAFDFEVLFVDDCSSDSTYELLLTECALEKDWCATQTPANSGSPSLPRNIGINLAKGEYVLFLDCDDELIPETLCSLIEYADLQKAQMVRTQLYVDNGDQCLSLHNMISDWDENLPNQQKVNLIMSQTSTVNTGLYRKDFLDSNKISWKKDIRMGEDTVFLAECISKAVSISYFSQPIFIYSKLPSVTASTTQQYGNKELQDQIKVWSTVQDLLQLCSVDYYKSRLGVGLRVAIESMIYRNRGDIDQDTFYKLNQLIVDNSISFSEFKFAHRIQEVFDAISQNNFSKFTALCKPRLLIAGHDLKFVNSVIPELSQFYDIRVDKWQGHDTHDENESRRLLDWAEYIWCEWLLGNSQWYSKYKKVHQRLVIRMHRFELGRNYGENLNIKNVDAIVAVSPLFFEKTLERFPNIPRHKMRCIPNYVRFDQYDHSFDDARLYTLGMIGILPSRKGFLRSLELLKSLRKLDQRFTLEIFGKMPEDLPWIINNDVERKYFNECKLYTEAYDLEEYINFNGFVDISKALASKKIGHILSLSDTDFGVPGFESFHIAILDGMAAKANVYCLDWPGSEHLWTKESIYENIEDMAESIYEKSRSAELFNAQININYEFGHEKYNDHVFINSIKNLFSQI